MELTERTVSSQTMGAKSTETNLKIPDNPSAIFSAFFMAIRLGMSSPKTILKYANINVMRTTQTELTTLSGMLIPAFIKIFTKGLAKLSAAKALPKKPANVIATCMVDKNFAG